MLVLSDRAGMQEGDVLGMPSKTRNSWDLIRFLGRLDDEIPVVEGQKIVAVSDHLSTRGTDEVETWLKDARPFKWSYTQGPRSVEK
jgi:hypothetical protein